MELGLDFDDNDFSDKVKEKPVLTSYNAKVCYNEWFLSEKADNGKNDTATLNKFRADYHYYHGNHREALQSYKLANAHLGSQNKTMRREVQESVIRCYIHIQDFPTALSHMDTLVSDCVTVDHYIQALLLRLKIYQSASYLKDELWVLQQLIMLHPLNASLWTQLGELYTKLRPSPCTAQPHTCVPTKQCQARGDPTMEDHPNIVQGHTGKCEGHIEGGEGHTNIVQGHLGKVEGHTERGEGHKRPEETHTRNKDKEPSIDKVTDNLINLDVTKQEQVETLKVSIHTSGDKVLLDGVDLDLILLTCFVRTRLILQTTRGTVGSFVKQQNTELARKIEEQIKALNVTEEHIAAADEFMRVDMFEDDREDGGTDNEEKVCDAKTLAEYGTGGEEFNTRWFGWMNDIPTHNST